jgi:beta-barrel assembly-enhancing protease
MSVRRFTFAFGLSLSLILGLGLPASSADNPSINRKAGDKPVKGSLEFSIWTETEKAERQAKTSGERNLDVTLNAYTKSILDKVSGEYKDDLRLYVMDRPFFNASMAPNGYTEIWTGLLLRAQTEDEVAFVMGHELSHFKRNHSIKAFENVRNSQNAAAAASIVIAVIGISAAGNAGSLSAAQDISNLTSGLINVVYLGSIASYFSYSRDNETEADNLGNLAAFKAGYDPYAGSRIWQFLTEETKASDYEKTRNRPTRSNVFGSHPLESVRITALDKQAKALKPSPDSDEVLKLKRSAYRDKIRPYLGAWLKDDLRRQDYGQTLFVISKLSADGLDGGIVNFYAGEAYRLRSKSHAGNTDLPKAVEAYQKAIAFPDAPMETQRQLGEAFRRLGNIGAALEAFKAYISAHPDAEDAWIVEDQIKTLLSPEPPTPTPVPTPLAPAPISAPAPTNTQ